MSTKERLHKLGDDRDDPILRALASAPTDNEPSGPNEDASAARALAAYRQGKTFSSEQLRAELHLDWEEGDDCR